MATKKKPVKAQKYPTLPSMLRKPIKIYVGRDIQGYEMVTCVADGKIMMLHEKRGSVCLAPVPADRPMEHKTPGSARRPARYSQLTVALVTAYG